MNRIICDICGSEYAQTSECCPICGYPRQGAEKTAAAAGAVDRAKVKGGRFSSKNVKKRRKAQQKAAAAEQERSDKPLIIVIILLLVAIALVSAYIAQRFIWGSGSAYGSGREPHTSTTAPADTTAVPTVPCAGILLDTPVITLDAPGQTQKLEPTVVPEDSTDALTFASSDEAVVRVSADGTLTAVGSGQAEITITCGSAARSCSVVCWFEAETTAPVETTVPPVTAAPTEAPKPTQPKPTQPKPTQPKPTEAVVLKLDPDDASCFTAGETFTIYARLGSSTVSRSKVKWFTSDPAIATVKDGVVTPVGKGTATITAEYEGKKATCTVRCRFENPTNQENQGGQEEQEPSANQTWRPSHSDVSIVVGESFRLTVKNSDGETADAIWTMSIDGVVAIDGKTITGRAPGTVTLTTTVEGQTFTCIVRVR